MKITAKTKICMIMGDPVEHSRSPVMHNAGYDVLGLDYVFIGLNVKKENLKQAVDGIRALGVSGVSVTIPHKIEVMEYLDEIDETAKKIGAVNTIINTDGKLTGYNTDWIGVVKPLEKITSFANKKILIVGAGGVSKSAVFGLLKKGAKNVGIYNRTPEKAKSVSAQFRIEQIIELMESAKNADVIINATSLGLNNEDELPIPIDYLNANQIVFDLAYARSGKTKFVNEAEKKGAKVITGIEMLLEQGYEQFKLFTGQDAPKEAMRKALL